MPHKHKRAKLSDASLYDLPPSTKAKALPVGKAQGLRSAAARQSKSKSNKAHGTRSKKAKSNDDTPKEFLRLMQLQATGKRPSGLDNGERAKRAKLKGTQKQAVVNPQQALPKPAILPGEKLSDFAARVDQAMPVTGLARKRKRIDGMREHQTKTEKRLQKMQAAWRREDTLRREKEEEVREQAEEELEDQKAMFEDKSTLLTLKGNNGRRQRMIGEQADKDDDPWAILKASRTQPRGLHDVVQAPPDFRVIPKAKFAVKNGARVETSNIPNSAGSVRQREELGETRKGIIERYRKMMDEKRYVE